MTGDDASPVKRMRLRRDGRCRCGAVVLAGTSAGWDRSARAVVCPRCLAYGPDVIGPAHPSAEPDLPRPDPSPSASDQVPARPQQVDAGTAGGSLRREYDRRVARREQQVRAAHPHLGSLILALTSEPASTRAFASGDEGERRAAARLQERCGQDVAFLFNRRLGRGRRDGDIDILAVGSSGVYVIDVKRYVNAKVEVRRSGGLFSPRREQLVIGGRDRTKLLDSVGRQFVAVTDVLQSCPGAEAVPVTSVLCFVDAYLPVLTTPTVVGIPLLGPKGTAKRLLAPGPLSSEARTELQAVLAAALPPA